MTDKVQLIKQEIERRISNLEQIGDRKEIEILFPEQFEFIKMYEGLLQFIDSIPEEPANEDLEEDSSFEKLLQEIYVKYDKKISIESLLDIASHFAEWQKQQIMKDSVGTTIVNDWEYGKDPDHAIIPAIHQRIDGFYVGDRVKIIIVKEEQQ